MYSIKSNRTKTHKGIRARLTLVYSTLFGLFLCIFAYIIAGQYAAKTQEEFDKALLNYAIDLANEINFEGQGMAPKIKIPPRELIKRFPFAISQSFFWVRDINGRILIEGRTGFPGGAIPYISDLALKEDYTHRYQDLAYGKDNYRALNLKFSDKHGNALILQVTSNSNTVVEQSRSNLLINFITIPLLIVIASIASYLVTDSAISPIKNVIETANNIAASNLSLRVPLARDTHDEVSELTKTFNHLLSRLEKSFKAQENFVANASHQLNTPLAIIKGELDVLESKTRSVEDYQRFHKSLREELERLIEMVKNMLLVSRVESGQDSFVFHPVRIDETIFSISSRLSLKAREKKVHLRFNMDPDLSSEELEIQGERQLLTCMFENILDNAIKYTQEGTTVAIELKRDESGELAIWFQDQGPGIEEAEYEHLLKDRFQRGEKNYVPGTGIGLPLAYQIAVYHKARISYKRLQPKGSLFIITFSK